MLKFDQLSIWRGNKELISDASFTIHRGQKVGITGANGAGKSSLFALLLGEIHADSGQFSIPANSVIAHVAQETPGLQKSALDYVLDGDVELRRIEHTIKNAEQNGDSEILAHCHAELEAINGYTARSRAATLMHGLGFKSQDENQPVNEFSGGWRVRLNLAKALMCRSDLLLLDEPTNHLDLDAVIWLEEWLRLYPGTLLLISHDRDFLDNIATHIAHIENGTMKLYTGNYSEFEQRRAQRLATQQAAYEKQQKEIQHIQSFVDRFRAKATKARQAQSRLKSLQRFQMISPAHVDSPFHFTFKNPDKLPNPLLKLEACSVGYGDIPILHNVNTSVALGARIGLLGKNGAGKSTYIKLIAGQLIAASGEFHGAKDLKVGYFAQHQLEQLDGKASPMLHLQRLHPGASETVLRAYIGGFGFVGDQALEPVRHFSGGEKARLVLALLVYQKPNLLLLDEPTNHLDLEMRHALTLALQDYVGALMVVSHDRHLLRTVCDTFYLVDNGQVREFDGDLDDYRKWLNEQDRKTSKPENESDKLSRKQQRQINAEKRRQLQPLRKQAQKLENEVEKLSNTKAEIELQLADHAIYQEENKNKLTELLKHQSLVQQALSSAEEQWLEIVEQLDASGHVN